MVVDSELEITLEDFITAVVLLIVCSLVTHVMICIVVKVLPAWCIDAAPATLDFEIKPPESNGLHNAYKKPVHDVSCGKMAISAEDPRKMSISADASEAQELIRKCILDSHGAAYAATKPTQSLSIKEKPIPQVSVLDFCEQPLWRKERDICTSMPSTAERHECRQRKPSPRQIAHGEIQQFARMAAVQTDTARYLLEKHRDDQERCTQSMSYLPLDRFEVLSLGNATGQVKLLIPLQRRAKHVHCVFTARGFVVTVKDESVDRRYRLVVTNLARTINIETSSWLLSDNKRRLKLFLRKEDPALMWRQITTDELIF